MIRIALMAAFLLCCDSPPEAPPPVTGGCAHGLTPSYHQVIAVSCPSSDECLVCTDRACVTVKVADCRRVGK